MAKARPKKRAATKTLSPKQMKRVKGGLQLSTAAGMGAKVPVSIASGISAKVPTI